MLLLFFRYIVIEYYPFWFFHKNICTLFRLCKNKSSILIDDQILNEVFKNLFIRVLLYRSYSVSSKWCEGSENLLHTHDEQQPSPLSRRHASDLHWECTGWNGIRGETGERGRERGERQRERERVEECIERTKTNLALPHFSKRSKARFVLTRSFKDRKKLGHVKKLEEVLDFINSGLKCILKVKHLRLNVTTRLRFSGLFSRFLAKTTWLSFQIFLSILRGNKINYKLCSNLSITVNIVCVLLITQM